MIIEQRQVESGNIGPDIYEGCIQPIALLGSNVQEESDKEIMTIRDHSTAL